MVKKILGLAAVYYASGRLGVLLAIPPGFATAVWPPSGVALAATLLFGPRVWPGIWLGSFAVNVGTTFDAEFLARSLLVPGLIASGASLQAVAGAFLIRRFVGFPTPLDRASEVAKFLALGGPASCLVNASIAVATLFSLGLLEDASSWAFTWWTWWVGDTIGVVIVTPLALVFLAEPRSAWQRRQLPVAVPLFVTFSLSVLLFVRTSAWESERMAASGGGRSWQAWSILAAALLFTGLLGALLLVVTGRTTALQQQSDERLKALEEKEVLLKEIHHRVKNNLQVVSSLLSMQSRQVGDPRLRGALEDSRSRVQSIALVHEALYRSHDLTRVDFAGYLRTLAEHLVSAYSSAGVEVSLDVAEARLPVDAAIPCGLIVNELVTNALKHAFPSGKGSVRIELKEPATGSYVLVVMDDGAGMPADADVRRSLGLDLVSTLARQLDAKIQILRERGTRYEITFSQR